jgi:hypothetical protein
MPEGTEAEKFLKKLSKILDFKGLNSLKLYLWTTETQFLEKNNVLR